MEALNYGLTILLAVALFANVVERAFKRRLRMALLEAKVQYLFENTGISDEPICYLASTISKELKEGKKIEAIALYREATGSSLKQAKNAIDDFVP